MVCTPTDNDIRHLSVKICCGLTRRTWWRLSWSLRVPTMLILNLKSLVHLLGIITYSAIQWRGTNLRIYNCSRSTCSFLLVRQSLTQAAWRYTHVEKTLGPTRLWIQSRAILATLKLSWQIRVLSTRLFLCVDSIFLFSSQIDHGKIPSSVMALFRFLAMTCDVFSSCCV